MPEGKVSPLYARITEPRDRVAITGSVIGLLSVALDWLTLKPSRLAAGTGLSLWESAGWDYAALILALWLVCLALSLTGGTKPRTRFLGVAANLALIASFVLTASLSGQVLERAAPFSRVSPAIGFWASAVGAYILLFATRQRLEGRLWRNLLTWAGPVLVTGLLASGFFRDVSILQEFQGQRERFLRELFQHIVLFGVAVSVGTLIGVPLGVWAARSRKVERPVFFFANITQTIPSLALFGLLIAPLSALTLAFPVLREVGIRGIGTAPALMALIVYSLLPIVRNTYVSLGQVDPAVVDAGFGMGMTRAQVFRRLEMPLAAPLVLEGVRIAAVQAVGLAAVAALIGAGGLGQLVLQGIGQAASDLIILGALPIIGLALVVDIAMRTLVRVVTPPGMAGESR